MLAFESQAMQTEWTARPNIRQKKKMENQTTADCHTFLYPFWLTSHFDCDRTTSQFYLHSNANERDDASAPFETRELQIVFIHRYFRYLLQLLRWLLVRIWSYHEWEPARNVTQSGIKNKTIPFCCALATIAWTCKRIRPQPSQSKWEMFVCGLRIDKADFIFHRMFAFFFVFSASQSSPSVNLFFGWVAIALDANVDFQNQQNLHLDGIRITSHTNYCDRLNETLLFGPINVAGF